MIKQYDKLIEKVKNGDVELSRADFRYLQDYERNKDMYDELGGTIVLESIYWEEDYDSIVKMLECGGVKRFYLADNSSGLMSTLVFLLSKGWTVVGAKQIKRGPLNYTKEMLLLEKSK